MKEFHKPKIYGISKIGPKGQIVIPSDAREELGLNSGERVIVMNAPHKSGLVVINENDFNQQLEHIKHHFSGFDTLTEEYKEQLRDNSTDA